MVVNEKALKRCMKEAYRNQGYTVAVYDGWMVINGGYWLVRMDETETSNELRSLIALHMRDIPQEDEACKTVKGDDGPIVQHVIMETAMKGVAQMEAALLNTVGDGGPTVIKRTDLRYNGAIIWQNAKDLAVLMVDPRYEALLESHKGVQRLGTGLYAGDMNSAVWALGISENALKEKTDHLALFRWVRE